MTAQPVRSRTSVSSWRPRAFALALVVAVVASRGVAPGRTLAVQGTPTVVDVSALDPDALFEALSNTAMSDVELPGTLRADDAEVNGYGGLSPSAGTVGINWPDDVAFINYFVFYTIEAGESAYSPPAASDVDAETAALDVDDGVGGGYCETGEYNGIEVDTCMTLRGNVLVSATGAVEAGIAPDLTRAAVAHLGLVADLVMAAGSARPGTSAADRSTAEAEVSSSLQDGTAGTVDPSMLLQALVSTEMSDVSLPGFLKSEDATVQQNADDEAVAGALGGVTITWSGLDEGKEIGLVVYPDEAAAGAAYAAEKTAVETELGVVPTFQTVDGLEGFCDVSSMATADESQGETCFLLSGNVVVTGVDDTPGGDANDLASAGVLHLQYVVRSLLNGDAGSSSTPVAAAVDPSDPESLLGALEAAEIGPEVELPAHLSAEEAKVNGLGPEYLEGDEVGAVAIVWGSDDPERQVDALIYLYVYETESAAEAAYGGDDEESAGGEARTFSVDTATASGTVEGTCVPVDEDEDGVDDYDFCATLSGNVLVVATDLTGANDGAALAAAGVEHVESVRGG